MQGSNIIGLTTFIPTIGGAALLPNTDGNFMLLIISIISTVGGGIVLSSTLVRFALKRIYRAS